MEQNITNRKTNYENWTKRKGIDVHEDILSQTNGIYFDVAMILAC